MIFLTYHDCGRTARDAWKGRGTGADTLWCPSCHIFVHCEAFAAETNKAVKTKKDGISKQKKQHGNKVGLPGKGLSSVFVYNSYLISDDTFLNEVSQLNATLSSLVVEESDLK